MADPDSYTLGLTIREHRIRGCVDASDLRCGPHHPCRGTGEADSRGLSTTTDVGGDMLSMRMREIEDADLLFAADCFRAAGCVSANVGDLESVLQFDRKGCLVAEDRGGPAGFCFAVRFDRCGALSVVIPGATKNRAMMERELLEQASAYLLDCGCEHIIADAPDSLVPACERFGFTKLGRIVRFAGTIYARSHQHIRAMRPQDLSRISALDRLCFGANRRFMLERRFSSAPQLCKILAANRNIGGYVMARRIQGMVAVGPWVMSSRDDCPMDLLEGVAIEAAGETLCVEVLDKNRGALRLLRAMGFVESSSWAWRMHFGPRTNIGQAHSLYAIGSLLMG
jgi:hypothetical protein